VTRGKKDSTYTLLLLLVNIENTNETVIINNITNGNQQKPLFWQTITIDNWLKWRSWHTKRSLKHV